MDRDDADTQLNVHAQVHRDSRADAQVAYSQMSAQSVESSPSVLVQCSDTERISGKNALKPAMRKTQVRSGAKLSLRVEIRKVEVLTAPDLEQSSTMACAVHAAARLHERGERSRKSRSSSLRFETDTKKVVWHPSAIAAVVEFEMRPSDAKKAATGNKNIMVRVFIVIVWSPVLPCSLPNALHSIVGSSQLNSESASIKDNQASAVVLTSQVGIVLSFQMHCGDGERSSSLPFVKKQTR